MNTEAISFITETADLPERTNNAVEVMQEMFGTEVMASTMETIREIQAYDLPRDMRIGALGGALFGIVLVGMAIKANENAGRTFEREHFFMYSTVIAISATVGAIAGGAVSLLKHGKE